MVYAMPACSGYLTESDVNSLKAVINKAFKLGYLSSISDLRSLISRSNRQLFNKFVCLCKLQVAEVDAFWSMLSLFEISNNRNIADV